MKEMTNLQVSQKSEELIDLIPKKITKQYISLISEKSLQKLLKNKDMLVTIRAFFDNDLNISQTSKKCFMHRNTLIYRLNKIENITGLNIKKFEDAVILKLIIKFLNA